GARRMAFSRAPLSSCPRPSLRPQCGARPSDALGRPGDSSPGEHRYPTCSSLPPSISYQYAIRLTRVNDRTMLVLPHIVRQQPVVTPNILIQFPVFSEIVNLQVQLLAQDVHIYADSMGIPAPDVVEFLADFLRARTLHLQSDFTLSG